ncbi:metallophosphoesterase family protein [Pedobacter sp. NJ-S-72]
MKIALFSDIHANLPALEAFFKDLETRNTDGIYCLGDLVGYNIWPNEVIDEIRKRGIPTIAGNYDGGSAGQVMIADAPIKQTKRRQWEKCLFLIQTK